ncbi:flagellar filament capping protein FliD [Mesobacillus harenae]|uniref:flagellar filament capping protein FliD n=1 Tax=Mesobacillus harenae TaxID=2213203 RepID=UPI001580C52E|nr:flagellar filament capping protein FliD [Mesobacillus harenae]
MRIGGLASGMDIDSIVGELMKAQRMPLDKLKQKRQVIEWQRDDYRSMNSMLLNFRQELTNMKLSTAYRARTTSSTNTDRVTATASSAASQSSYSISRVDQLASAATRITNEGISADSTNKIDASKSLYSQQAKLDSTSGFTWSEGSVGSKTIAADGTSTTFSLGLNAGEQILTAEASKMSVKVNGAAYQIVTDPAATLTSNQVLLGTDGSLTFSNALAKDSSIKVDYITDQKVTSNTLTAETSEWQLGGGITGASLSLQVGTASYVTNGAADAEGFTQLVANGDPTTVLGKINLDTGKVVFNEPQAVGTELSATYKQQYSAFNITSQTSKGAVSENFLVASSESLSQVVSKVNSSNAGVSMFYDSFSDKVSLTRKETGDFLAGAGNEISATGTFAADLLKFSGSTETGGQNAIFTINGLQTERNTNTFTMDGVTFTLKQTFTDGNAVSINVSNDTTKVFDNIKGFIDKYNELIDKISKKTSEEYYRSYSPLTDQQREDLSDKQQEKWEEMAKSGLLRRDPILSQALSGMRSDFYAPVQNADVNPLFNQLASIGIKTTANYLEGGKLQIDEAKLKKAIEEDPTSVENLFRATGTTDSEKGILHRLTDTTNEAMNKLKERAGNTFSTNQQFMLGRQLSNVDKQINRFEDRMKTVEDRYWRQFTAMEKAIQKANSQSSYLMQQFSM